MTSQPHDQALLFDVPRDTQLELELESAPAQVKLCPSNLGAKRCAVCARLQCEPGHERRLVGTPRPRGEVRFPAGSLVQVMAGPVSAIGRLAVVEDVESRTMRALRLGRDGAGVDYVRVGLRGLRLYVGKDSAL